MKTFRLLPFPDCLLFHHKCNLLLLRMQIRGCLRVFLLLPVTRRVTPALCLLSLELLLFYITCPVSECSLFAHSEEEQPCLPSIVQADSATTTVGL